MDKPNLRPVTSEDEPLLFEIYSSTRMEELALVPWSQEQQHAFLESQFKAQQHHYQTYFSNTTHEIIEWNGTAVGRIYIARQKQELTILDVTILPEFRSRGLGEQVVSDLIDEARTKNLPLRIYVEHYNPSVRFFERLGFVKVSEEGLNLLLEWNPASASAD